MSSALRYQKIGKTIVNKNYRFVALIFLESGMLPK
jgi:hypothetical protein